jgi:hypothetical protein
MALLISDSGGGPHEKPVPGMVDAVCVFVVDIGNHLTKSQYGDKIQHKIVICWEIDQLLQEVEYKGKPFMVSSRYTFTLFEKGNLSKMLESWFSKKIPDETRKKGIDLETLIGKKCTLNLIESDDGKYINVGAVLPASKTNVLVQVCTTLPVWIQKLIDSQIKVVPQERQPGEDEPQQNEQLPF